MLINLSNHPSHNWSKDQLWAAQQYGEIIDLPFPNIPPEADIEQLEPLLNEYYNKILSLGDASRVVVHLMGEMTFTFMLLSRLLNVGYRCVSSTTNRIVEEIASGEKRVLFQFCQFRDYQL